MRKLNAVSVPGLGLHWIRSVQGGKEARPPRLIPRMAASMRDFILSYECGTVVWAAVSPHPTEAFYITLLVSGWNFR